MKLYELLGGHAHYWGVPHLRDADNRLIQTCYGCSKDRLVRIELRPTDPLTVQTYVRPLRILKGNEALAS
jgi:hypothetical protein